MLLTEDAQRDLEEIHDYITEFDTSANAGHVLNRMLEVVESLATFPERGAYPKELLALGIREYRQTLFKPCHETQAPFLTASGRRRKRSTPSRGWTCTTA